MNGENQEKLSLGRWRHFKGGEYQVYGVAIHSETEEEYVVYRPLYGEGKLWIRPLSMWLEDVERETDSVDYTPFEILTLGWPVE